jgi:hypothetical protein
MVAVNTHGMTVDHIFSTELNYFFTFVDSISLHTHTHTHTIYQLQRCAERFISDVKGLKRSSMIENVTLNRLTDHRGYK